MRRSQGQNKLQAFSWIRKEIQYIGFDWLTTVIICWAALALTIEFYPGHDNAYWSFLSRNFGLESARFLRKAQIDLPLLINVGGSIALLLLLRQPLRHYGLGLGNIRLGLSLIIVFFILYLPLMWIFASSEGFQSFYGRAVSNYNSWPLFLEKRVPQTFLFMIRNEFFFRGLILFALAKKYGIWAGILGSTLPFVMWHFNKPEIEALGSLPVGIALAYMAIRTRSIWYGVILHASIALLMEAMLIAKG